MAAARPRRLMASGATVVSVLAVVLTVTDVIVLTRYGVDPVFAWLQVPVLMLAWSAPVAWSNHRWTLAGVGLLAMLGGAWGYLYVPPLIALLLACVAFSRALRNRA